MRNMEEEMTEQTELQRNNNPKNEPVGHFTGRCMKCHSRDLWDDATAYGCNCCDALYLTGDMLPRIIPNNEKI